MKTNETLKHFITSRWFSIGVQCIWFYVQIRHHAVTVI